MNAQIDFVADCGADPTGVADCAAAFDHAGALLLAAPISPPRANSPLRLFVPPGVYALKSAPTTGTWDFNTKSTSVEIVGAGVDSTIFQLYGFDPPAVANTAVTRFADFTVQGTKLGVGNDCQFGFLAEYALKLCLFERLRFFNVRGQYSALHSYASVGIVDAHDIDITCCGSATAGYGVLSIRAFVEATVTNLCAQDVGQLNGVQYNGNILGGSSSWLAVLSNSAIAGPWSSVKLSGLYLDENVVNNVIVGRDPSDTVNLRSAHLEGIYINPPVQGGATGPAIVCNNIDRLVIDRARNSGLQNSSTGDFVSLIAVTDAELRGLVAKSGGVSRKIRTDASCAHVQIVDGQNLDLSAVNASTFLEPRANGALLPGPVPPTPAAGFYQFVDQTDGNKLKVKNSSGVLTTLAT